MREYNWRICDLEYWQFPTLHSRLTVYERNDCTVQHWCHHYKRGRGLTSSEVWSSAQMKHRLWKRSRVSTRRRAEGENWLPHSLSLTAVDKCRLTATVRRSDWLTAADIPPPPPSVHSLAQLLYQWISHVSLIYQRPRCPGEVLRQIVGGSGMIRDCRLTLHLLRGELMSVRQR